jgi:hypothetical protein
VLRQSRASFCSMSKLSQRITIGTVIVAISIGASGCRRQSSDVEGPPDTSTYRPLPTPATEFEQKLKDVSDAHFQFVWVFRRLDGKAFTSADSEILRTNAPRVVDWVGLDDKTTYIAGSNFPIAPENLAALQKRYKIEDYSGR